MSSEPFVDGDKITMVKIVGGWRIEMQVSNGGGIIGPAVGPIYPTAEEALKALARQTETLKR